MRPPRAWKSWSATASCAAAGEGLEFSHDRIREVAAEELPAPLRVALHRRVAESLEELYRHDLPDRTRWRSPRTIARARSGTRRWRTSRRRAVKRPPAPRIRRPSPASRRPRHAPAPSGEPQHAGPRSRPPHRSAAKPVPAGPPCGPADHLREAERLAETLDDRLRLGRCLGLRQQPRLDHRRSAAGAGVRPAGACAGESWSIPARGGGELPAGPGPLEPGPVPGGGDVLRELGTAAARRAAAPSDPLARPTEFGLAELGLYWMPRP